MDKKKGLPVIRQALRYVCAALSPVHKSPVLPEAGADDGANG